jgi:hypothetical protein
LLLHLAATETYYQMNTFEKIKWDSWPDAVKQKWDPAMNLGDAGRKTLEGNELGYYLDALRETREKSLAEFRKRRRLADGCRPDLALGDPQTITASGFRFTSTNRTTLDRSIC